jgi:hypothetical protein
MVFKGMAEALDLQARHVGIRRWSTKDQAQAWLRHTKHYVYLNGEKQ